MKKNAMRKNLRQSIIKSLGRYLAIVAIIALGASLFVGLLMTKSDMVATGQRYMDEQNMFDLRLVSSYGWAQEQLDAISMLEGVVDTEGLIYSDLIVHLGESTDDSVYRFYSIPETVNKIVLRGGRMPEKPDECLADGFMATDELLGTQVILSDNNSEDALDSMSFRTYTIVGYVSTPLYLDMNRGTTSVGNGSLSSYFYIPREGFDVDYYTEINITLPGAYAIYTDKYHDMLESEGERLEELLKPVAEQRLIQVREEAETAWCDGMAEYEDGLAEYRKGKREAELQLQDARRQLEDGQREIRENERLLADGLEQIAEGRQTLKDSEKTLQESKKLLADTKASAYKQISASTTEMLSQMEPLTADVTRLTGEVTAIQSELIRINSSITQFETELTLIDSQIAQNESMIGILDTSISTSKQALELARQNGADEATLAEMEQEIRELEDSRAGYVQTVSNLQTERTAVEEELAPLYAQRKEKEAEQQKLNAQIDQLESSLSTMTEGLMTLIAAQSVMDAEFAAADAQIEAGEAQIQTAYLELDQREKEIIDGKAELEQAKLDLADGWKEYEEGRAEARQELSDAYAELKDAAQELADARETIDGMTENEVFVLGRNTNVGYNSLDSASDIVQGVSRVFPAFFLLVASLVCITTMTRMIDEERTQIGTLKALGYSNGAIISKYLLYAGSGAVIGCGLGVLVGSMIFPSILWQAYKIMLYITDGILLRFNWLLCGIVVAAYTAVMLLVTWYCCRRALEEEPAELIRPKAPDPGKQILLERLPIWHKISFLNKVTIRNILRYRQRLAMMIVGIGGCTALLVTGFGLRDSIVNVVDYQFEEVTVYDMTVYFSEGRTEAQKAEFLSETEDMTKNVMFYHQESVELEANGSVREIYLITGQEKVREFIDLHSGDEPLAMPDVGQVLLTVGVAEAMGIDVGDPIILRNADMELLEVTVSGIYDNHVYNYAIVTPETVEEQWGRRPDDQMAFVQVAEGRDVHQVSAELTGLDGVMNISVSEDLANMVGSMMDALDLVVWVIVFCAGLLAAIVLYNLTNININERIREIATIKVLGFRAGETGAYVFKENLTLSAVGSVAGLALGYLLLLFVMTQIKIDMVYFKALVMPQSYVISVVLTMLAACIVDFIFYFKLDKINMAEALKSVE